MEIKLVKNLFKVWPKTWKQSQYSTANSGKFIVSKFQNYLFCLNYYSLWIKCELGFLLWSLLCMRSISLPIPRSFLFIGPGHVSSYNFTHNRWRLMRHAEIKRKKLFIQKRKYSDLFIYQNIDNPGVQFHK